MLSVRRRASAGAKREAMITPGQLGILRSLRDEVLVHLTEAQRFDAKLVGVRDWVRLLSKWEARQIIARAGEAEVARVVRRRPSSGLRGMFVDGGIDKEDQTG